MKRGDGINADAMLLFGRVARKHHFVLLDDLEECLAIQQKLRMMGGNRMLGEILVDQEYLTVEHVKWILARQKPHATLPEETTRFGDLAVVNGFLSPGAVARALKIQRRKASREETRRIGEVLVAEGVMMPAERDAILSLQHRIRGQADSSSTESRRVLLIEVDGDLRWRARRTLAAILLVGALLLALAALVGFIVLR